MDLILTSRSSPYTINELTIQRMIFQLWIQSLMIMINESNSTQFLNDFEEGINLITSERFSTTQTRKQRLEMYLNLMTLIVKHVMLSMKSFENDPILLLPLERLMKLSLQNDEKYLNNTQYQPLKVLEIWKSMVICSVQKHLKFWEKIWNLNSALTMFMKMQLKRNLWRNQFDSNVMLEKYKQQQLKLDKGTIFEFHRSLMVLSLTISLELKSFEK